MSSHFTQFCAFIAYLFRFMGYCLCFIGAKIHIFSKSQGIGCVFSLICVSALDRITFQNLQAKQCGQFNKPLGINHYTRDSSIYRSSN